MNAMNLSGGKQGLCSRQERVSGQSLAVANSSVLIGQRYCTAAFDWIVPQLKSELKRLSVAVFH
jgi:hypothetical protein